MDIFFSIIILIALGFIIKYSPFFRGLETVSFKLLIFLFVLKCIAGFLFLYIYKYYYDPETADVYKYFHDGTIMLSALKENPVDYFRMLSGIDANAEHLQEYYSKMISWYRPWEEPMYNDNRIVIRFNALIGIISFGNIYIHSIAANFLSFTGLFAIAKFAGKRISVEKMPYVVAGIFLFPSVLFWSSGILKESILFFALGLFLLYADKIINKDRKVLLVKLLIILGSIFLLILLKAYIFLLLVPLLITYYIISGKEKKSNLLLYPIIFALWASMFLLIGYVFPEYSPIKIITAKQNSFVMFSQHIEAGSLYSKELLKPELTSLIKSIPLGFWNTLTRPHLLDSRSIVILIAAFENLIIWIMIISLFFLSKRKNIKNPFTWFCFSFVILTFILVGIVTPVYGGLVRYKIPALPFLWLGIISLIEFEVVKNILNKTKLFFQTVFNR